MSTGPIKKRVLNKEFNPLILEEILKRHWRAPIIYTIIFLIFAYLYIRYSVPIYQTKALVQVVEENKTRDILGKDALNVEKALNLNQEVELLRSELLINKVIEKLGIHTNLYSKGTILTQNLYRETGFSLMVYSLNDSSLCETQMHVSV
ncbi:MAG: Wzz/FepE/Etk N-terminal domain-containing protein, partial [Crocinitomicaceae bacterium]